jgi:hypothetical protein
MVGIEVAALIKGGRLQPLSCLVPLAADEVPLADKEIRFALVADPAGGSLEHRFGRPFRAGRNRGVGGTSGQMEGNP